MTIAGTWDVTIKTPIGSLAVVYTVTETVGAQSGSATSGTRGACGTSPSTEHVPPGGSR